MRTCILNARPAETAHRRESSGLGPLARLCTMSLAAWVIFAASPAGAVDLVIRGKPSAVIVVPDSAYSSVTRAAWELQHHVSKASGAVLDIVIESKLPAGQAGCVYLGACQAAVRAGITTDKLARNAFVLKTVGGDLFISGRDTDGSWLGGSTHVGTLFGVYELLDRYMGVRWLWPGELGEFIPRRETISIGPQDRTVTLRLLQTRMRVFGFMNSYEGWAERETRDEFLTAQAIWMRRHRFGWDSSLDIHHGFTDYWKRFGETHPEYFNLLPDGTRRPDPYHLNGAGSLIGMCVAEPRFWQQIVDDWKTKRSPAYPYIDASENDTYGKCLDPRCLAWDMQDPDLDIPWDKRVQHAKKAFQQGEVSWPLPLGSLSDRYCRFYLAVQKLAEQTDPQAVVMGFAYANYTKPPIAAKLNDRIIIGFVGDIMYPWTSEKIDQFQSGWDGWSATGARLMWRPNFMLDGHCMPICIAPKLAGVFNHAFTHGLIGTDFDSLTGQYGTQGLNLYTLARLQRHGDWPAKKVFNEYFGAFGPAAAAMREYFAYWERISDAITPDTLAGRDAGEKGPGGGHWSRFYVAADLVFTPQVMAKGRELLAKAREAAQGDPLAGARVAFLAKGLKNAEMVLATQAAYRRYKQDGDVAAFGAKVNELDAYRASVEKDYIANMAYLVWSENRTWSRSMVKMMGKGGASLTDPWKFMWDPEENGHTKAWQTAAFDDSKWFDIGTAAPWEQQPIGRQWFSDHASSYDGIAWYRKTFTVGADAKPARYLLGFGAVDEACKIWLNDELILTRPFPYKGDTESWQKAFEIDVTKLIRRDKPNTLVVRVEDRIGAGGIWRGVRLLTLDR